MEKATKHSKRKLRSFARIIGKLRKLRKTCNHKRNINRRYNEKLLFNCLHQLPTLRLKTSAFSSLGGLICPHKKKKKKDLRKLGNSGERKWKAQTRALYPVCSLEIQFYSYLAENSRKATLNSYFKLKFSVKPSKFQIYFANDCRLEEELSKEELLSRKIDQCLLENKVLTVLKNKLRRYTY